MRVCLILASNLYVSPYVSYYTAVLQKLEIDYDVITWNRFGVQEEGVTAYDRKSDFHKGRLGKLMDWLGYRRFVKERLIDGNYDKVVVFTIQMGLMLFLFLIAQYKNKYVLDIRDYSIVQKVCRVLLSETIKNSAFVCISSNGFKRWLPKGREYFIRHNIQTCESLKLAVDIGSRSRYKILTIGSLRDYKANRFLIEQLKNSSIFELEYVGSGPAEPLLRDFVENNGIDNVRFFGRYQKEDERRFLQGVSLINILTNRGINSITLMTNRFYLSLVHGIPMIVDDNTEQARWVKEYGLGIVVDREANIKEEIVNYLQGFDPNHFNAGRKAVLELVRRENTEFEAAFKAFLTR